MKFTHGRYVTRRGRIRAGLSFLAVAPLVVGSWALFAPRSFYDGFPSAGRHWVSALGPYNEHLVRDVGAMNLALGVLLTLAAVLLERKLVRATLVVWLVYAVPHFAFHLTMLDAFSPLDNAMNVAGLGLSVLLPSFLLALAGQHGTPRDEAAVDGEAEGNP